MKKHNSKSENKTKQKPQQLTKHNKTKNALTKPKTQQIRSHNGQTGNDNDIKVNWCYGTNTFFVNWFPACHSLQQTVIVVKQAKRHSRAVNV